MFYSFCVRGQCLVRRVINHVSVFVDFLREGETICSHSPLKVDTGGSDDLTDHPPASTKRGMHGTDVNSLSTQTFIKKNSFLYRQFRVEEQVEKCLSRQIFFSFYRLQQSIWKET